MSDAGSSCNNAGTVSASSFKVTDCYNKQNKRPNAMTTKLALLKICCASAPLCTGSADNMRCFSHSVQNSLINWDAKGDV